MNATPRQPKAAVSVVIPVYNGGAMLEAAVASVFAQTVAATQVIVINDGSTDDTEDRLRRLASTLPPTFTWHSKPNGGNASAYEFGTRLATGDCIAFLDHDDIWHPTKLERQLQHLDAAADVVLSFTGYTTSYDSYRPTPGRSGFHDSVIDHDHWDPDPEIVLNYLFSGRSPVGPMSTVMIRRHALAQLPPFDEQLSIACDISMYFELVVRRMRMDYLPEPLVQYHWHGSNLSRDVGRFWEDLCIIEDKIYTEHADNFSRYLRARAREWRTHWHLQSAIDAIRLGDKARARRHILKAARTRPSAIRPGWVRMLGIGSPPVGPWPE